MLNPHNSPRNIVLLVAFFFGATVIVPDLSFAQEILTPILDEAETASDEDLELLTRGPLHEAFATSAPLEPQPGIVVQKKPPVDVQELPPDYESVEDNEEQAVWIPGYWSWDEEREDYIWVSGAWRIPPIDRRWVPGYWNETSEGWQWVSGFWAPAAVEELEYVEPPPESLEAGPSIPAPSQNHFWIPGTWIYQSQAYNWRPGYWRPFEENRVWVSAHYVSTPSGCLFVNGYWDHVLAQRGYLYAPVYFHRPVTYYRPHCGIRLGNLLLHLFVSRHHYGYHFGDYYGPSYRHRGHYPLFEHHLAARRYNPLLTYYDLHYRRHGIDSRARLKGWHKYYASHPKHRPPHTWSAQQRFAHGKDADRYRSRTVLGYAPKPHAADSAMARNDRRFEAHRDRHQQLRDIAEHRKDVETGQHRLADVDRKSRQLRLPQHLRSAERAGDRELVGTEARRSRANRLDAGRAGIRANSVATELLKNRDADGRSEKRTNENATGRDRDRSDRISQDSREVGPQKRRLLQNRGDIGEVLKSRQDRRANVQSDRGSQLSLDRTRKKTTSPSTGQNNAKPNQVTTLPRPTRENVERRNPRRTPDVTGRNKSTTENRTSRERYAGNQTTFRTETAGKNEKRGARTDSPSASRSVTETRQPTRILRFDRPTPDTKSSAKNAGGARSQQPRTIDRGDLQRRLEDIRARQKTSSASSTTAEKRQRSPAPQLNAPKVDTKSRSLSSGQETRSERGVRQSSSSKRSDLQRQVDAGRTRARTSSASRTAAEKRPPVNTSQLSTRKPDTQSRSSRSLSSPKNTSSARDQRQPSSYRSGDSQRQTDSGRSRQSTRSPSRSSDRATSRATSEQRSSARAAEISRRTPRAPARTESVTKSRSSARSSQPRSSYTGRDLSRQSSASRSRQPASASRSRQQTSSSRIRSAPAPSTRQSSSTRSRSSSARSRSPSRQTRQAASRGSSSSRQQRSAPNRGRSNSSGRSGGKKSN